MDQAPRILDKVMGDEYKMNRRNNDALYFPDELIRRVLEHRPVQLWDSVNMLFPKETNRKQFDCALKFLQELEKRGSIQNTEARGLFESETERIMLAAIILPKLRKFGVIESAGGRRKYLIRFGSGFSLLFRDLGLELFGYYARHMNERNQLERHTNQESPILP